MKLHPAIRIPVLLVSCPLWVSWDLGWGIVDFIKLKTKKL